MVFQESDPPPVQEPKKNKYDVMIQNSEKSLKIECGCI